MKERRSQQSQGGFTMIEAVLAMLLLAVGLLAIAAMVNFSMGRNVDASELSIATNLAADMVERIRFNKANVTAYNNIDTLNAATQPLTTQPMARGDYSEWSTRLTNSRLRNVQGTVQVVPIGPQGPVGVPGSLNQNQVTVAVRWFGGSNVGNRSAAVAGQQAGPIATNYMRAHNVNLVTVLAPD